MDSLKLADRLRGRLKLSAISPEGSGLGRISSDDPAASIGQVLGGEWRYEGDATCFVVERRVRADSSHGRVKVGDMAAQLETSATCASWLAEPNGARPVRPPFIFFDLETTGLSGGAGTYAFVVGCGRFAEDGTFIRNEYVLANTATNGRCSRRWHTSWRGRARS